MSRPIRKRDPDAVRRALREQALKSFDRDGYEGTNSNALARAAGYAAGTFYTQYADKRELFIDAYRLWVDREWRAVETALATAAGSKRPAIVVRVLLEHHRRWAGFRRSLRALALREPEVARARNEQRRRQMVWLQTYATAHGDARPSAARALATLLQAERILDAIADGDVVACGVAERAVLRELEAIVAGLFETGASGARVRRERRVKP